MFCYTNKVYFVICLHVEGNVYAHITVFHIRTLTIALFVSSQTKNSPEGVFVFENQVF